MEQAKILLVDDHPENLMVLRETLEPLGHGLVLAHSGREALKHLLIDDFALILLDVQMPGMDGFETADFIKSREKSKYIPIIFITAINRDRDTIFRGYTAGAVDYLSKPFDPDILKSKVSVFVDLFLKSRLLQKQSELLRLSEQREAEFRMAEREYKIQQRHAAQLADAAARQRVFFRDVLTSVTEGHLRLCHTKNDLPDPLPQVGDVISLMPLDGLQTLRHCVRDVAVRIGFPEDRKQDLLTAVSEAAMNAIVHAGSGMGRVCVNDADRIQVWIIDCGEGIELESLPRATLERGFSTKDTLGHGFWLMLKTTDHVYLLTGEQGTTVVLEQDKVASLPTWMLQDEPNTKREK